MRRQNIIQISNWIRFLDLNVKKDKKKHPVVLLAQYLSLDEQLDLPPAAPSW